MSRARLLVALALLCGGYTLSAQDNEEIHAQQANAASASLGKALFQQNCAFCHGPDARGASGPDLIRSPLVSHDANGNLIGPVIRDGRPEKGMPAFQLSNSQILQVADFLHSEAKIAATVANTTPTEYPLAKLLVGNARDGNAFFNGAGKCGQCHSPIGDLAHIASKYKPIDLQTRIAFPSGAASTVTVTEISGKKFTGDQVYADEFTISLRDHDGWIRTWNRRKVTVEIHDPLAEHEKLLTIYTDKNIHDLFAYLETLK